MSFANKISKTQLNHTNLNYLTFTMSAQESGMLYLHEQVIQLKTLHEKNPCVFHLKCRKAAALVYE